MKDKLKKYLLPNLPYLFFVYLFDKLCQAVRLAPGLDASEKLLHIGQGFQTAFASSAPSFHALDICVGILGAVLVRLTVYVKGKNAKKYRKGIEYGSARWSACTSEDFNYTNFVALIVGQFPYAFTIRKNLRLLDIIFAILVAEHLR